GLRDYRVDTGHLTLYWDSGWHGVQAAVSAGRYLAGDRGITVDLARAYANGTRIGLWATKTSVSAAAFGEGSFDKGVYVSIPFDLLFSVWSKETMKIVWQPLIRDGGARLDRAVTLWGLTAPSAQ
ncbi:MAG: YjbH domain-containing protein, partial [Burkholderiales bacterium]|nr:YjbH domain-containing protein [Burkholderiales bacterium]